VMMNGNFPMAKQPLFFVLMLSYFLFTAHFSWAGNAEIIEKKVEQMDQLNKNIVAKIPKLPKKGHVAVNATIGYTKRSITYKKYNAETSQIKEGTIHLDNNQKIINSETRGVKG